MWQTISGKSGRSISLIRIMVYLIITISSFTSACTQPLSSFTNEAIDKVNTFMTEKKVTIGDSTVRAKIEIQKESEEILAQTRNEVDKWIEEQKAREAREKVELNQEYALLFNEFRLNNGSESLIFDEYLNELAKNRVSEISRPGNFSHAGIAQYNVGENIAMMKYSTSSNTELIELWANSPGHRSNMLSVTYSRTGFARDGRYAVQVFQ